MARLDAVSKDANRAMIDRREKKPSIRINVGDVSDQSKVVLITDVRQVASVIEKFRAKYGTNDVKKYYSKFDVPVLVQMG